MKIQRNAKEDDLVARLQSDLAEAVQDRGTICDGPVDYTLRQDAETGNIVIASEDRRFEVQLWELR